MLELLRQCFLNIISRGKRNRHYYMTMYMFYREYLQPFTQRGPVRVKQDRVIKEQGKWMEQEDRD